jgi:hypothetical protein
MPRTQEVTLGKKKITVKESSIRELRNDILPKLTGIKDGIGTDTQMTDLFSIFTDKVTEIFPDITADDIDDAFPSEIEELVQAFIDVNFGGLKKILPLAISFIRNGTQTQQ